MQVHEMAHIIAVSDLDKAVVPDYGVYLPNRYAAVIDQQLGQCCTKILRLLGHPSLSFWAVSRRAGL